MQKFSIIARGLGRSYGDAAQLNKGSIIKLDSFNHIKLDIERGVIRVEAECFHQLLKVIIPKGFFIPVLQGQEM